MNAAIGYCLNSEDHYGRLCECGACYACCTCYLGEERKARRGARLESYRKAVRGTPLADIVREANLALAGENLRLRVDRTNKHGLHVALTKFGSPVAKLPAKDWTVDALVTEARSHA